MYILISEISTMNSNDSVSLTLFHEAIFYTNGMERLEMIAKHGLLN